MEKAPYTHTHMLTYFSSDLAMADSPKHNLTPKAQELLDALLEADEWVGRSKLATRFNKNVLNKWDLVLLSKLEDAGLIEMRQIPHHGPIGYEWQYHAI